METKLPLSDLFLGNFSERSLVSCYASYNKVCGGV